MNESVASAVGGMRDLLPQRSDCAAMRRNPKRDVIAGLTVAVVALPLALAFGVASGLGAGAGMVTAVIAGVLAAVFGGSNLQVSGPTGAMTVVLLPIVGDALVLVATALATIVFDLVTAVIVGLVIAGLYALRQMARSARVEELPLDSGDHSREEQALLDQHVVAYRLDGPLFFGAAHRFLMEVAEVSDVRVVILRLSRVQTLDATGASVLGETIKTLEGRGITVLLSGIRAGHEEVFRVVGVFDELAHERHVFATTPEAIAHAREHLAKGPHHQVPSS